LSWRESSRSLFKGRLFTNILRPLLRISLEKKRGVGLFSRLSRHDDKMKSFIAGVSWLVAVTSASGSLQHPTLPGNPYDPPESLLQQLGPKLSSGAEIRLPNSAAFNTSTARWSPGRLHPSFLGAVDVATEKDIQVTVR